MSGSAREASRMSGSGRETLLDVREVSRPVPDLREGLPTSFGPP